MPARSPADGATDSISNVGLAAAIIGAIVGGYGALAITAGDPALLVQGILFTPLLSAAIGLGPSLGFMLIGVLAIGLMARRRRTPFRVGTALLFVDCAAFATMGWACLPWDGLVI